MFDKGEPIVKAESKREWDERSTPRKPLGQWLVENVPRGIELELPDRKDEPEREIPFQVWASMSSVPGNP